MWLGIEIDVFLGQMWGGGFFGRSFKSSNKTRLEKLTKKLYKKSINYD
jgi:hypothetical protein